MSIRILVVIHFLLPILISSEVIGSTNGKVKKVERCYINVQRLLQNGEKNEDEFNLSLKSKEACEKAAKKHEINFNPASVKEVYVIYKWNNSR